MTQKNVKKKIQIYSSVESKSFTEKEEMSAWFVKYLKAKKEYAESPKNISLMKRYDIIRKIILDNHPFVKSRTKKFGFKLGDGTVVEILMRQWDIASRKVLGEAGLELKRVADPSGTAFAASPIVSECLNRGTHFVRVSVGGSPVKVFFVLGAPKFSGMNEGDDDDDQGMTSDMFCNDGKSIRDCSLAITTEKANGINGKGCIHVVDYLVDGESRSFVLVCVGTKGTLTFFPLIADYDEMYPADKPKDSAELDLLKKMPGDLGYPKLLDKVRSVKKPTTMRRELALTFQKWLRGLSDEKLMEFADLFRTGHYTSMVFEGLLPDDEHMVELPNANTIIVPFTFIDHGTSKPIDPREALRVFNRFELPVYESGAVQGDAKAVLFSVKHKIVSAEIFQNPKKRDEYLAEMRQRSKTEGNVIYMYYHTPAGELRFLGMFKVKASDYITFRFLRQLLLRSGKTGFGPFGYIGKLFGPKPIQLDLNALRSSFITSMVYCRQEIYRLKYVGSWETYHEAWMTRMLGFIWNYLFPLWEALVASLGEMDGTKCFYYLFKTQYGTMISEFLASGRIKPEFPDSKWYEAEIAKHTEQARFNVKCLKYISAPAKGSEEEVLSCVNMSEEDILGKTPKQIDNIKLQYNKQAQYCRTYADYVKRLLNFVAKYRARSE